MDIHYKFRKVHSIMGYYFKNMMRKHIGSLIMQFYTPITSEKLLNIQNLIDERCIRKNEQKINDAR